MEICSLRPWEPLGGQAGHERERPATAKATRTGLSVPLLTVQGVEVLLVVVVAMLWWKIVRDRRERQQRAQAPAALSVALSTLTNLGQGAIMANTDGYTYWFVGDTLVRAPLVQGEADRDQVEAADPVTCPDLTPDLVDEIAGELRQAADDLLRGR